MEQQPHSRGDDQPFTPEQREHLRINSVVIPADEDEPLRQGDIGVANTSEYREIVGGYLEAVSLDSPSSTLYVNEQGKLNDLPINPRATMLLRAHQPALRFFDYIAGDALLTGPVDEQGDDTNVPDEFVNMFFQARRFRAEVQTFGDPGWYGNQLHFDSWTDAYGYVLNLAQRWTQVEDVRVVTDE
jgi:hypothetical protein